MCNNSSYWQSSSILYQCGYSIIMLLGLVFNSIAIYFFYHLPKLRSPTTIYMKNLAFADLLLVCTLPLRIYGFNLSPSSFLSGMLRVVLCDIAGTLLLLNMYGSIFLLTCISLDRYLAVCFPLRSRHIRQKAAWICVCVWFLNFTSCIANYASSGPKNGTSCFYGQPPFVTKKGPTIGAVSMGFLVPVGIISVTSVIMLREISQSHIVQEGLVNKAKILHMFTANISIFLLCFLPYHTVLILYQVLDSNCAINEAYKITLLAACCNTILDPIVYYFASETMKNMVKEEIKVGKFRFVELSELSFEKKKQTNDKKCLKTKLEGTHSKSMEDRLYVEDVR